MTFYDYNLIRIPFIKKSSMSIFDLIQNLMSKPKNPELDKVRQQHDNLPTSKYFDDTNISDEVFLHDYKESVERGHELALVFVATIQEHYTRDEIEKVTEDIVRCVSYLIGNCRMFPDVDYKDIWYTDYYDLIQLAQDMRLGDYSLPHWPEEQNISRRYLELTVSDLVQIFLAFLEESIIEEYSFEDNTEEFTNYLLRETLKTRRRVRRQKDRESQTIPFIERIPTEL